MRFIHYIYKYTPTYRVTFPSYPTRETKVQIGMALVEVYDSIPSYSVHSSALTRQLADTKYHRQPSHMH